MIPKVSLCILEGTHISVWHGDLIYLLSNQQSDQFWEGPEKENALYTGQKYSANYSALGLHDSVYPMVLVVFMKDKKKKLYILQALIVESHCIPLGFRKSYMLDLNTV